MNRRTLFKSLLGTALLPFAAPLQARAARRRLLIQESPLAGFQYHQGEHLWPRLCPGDPLALVREPDNPYDPRAVRVDWHGHKLGYVPRRENTAVSQMLDRGERLEAHIAELRQSFDPWQRIALAIWLEGAA